MDERERAEFFKRINQNQYEMIGRLSDDNATLRAQVEELEEERSKLQDLLAETYKKLDNERREKHALKVQWEELVDATDQLEQENQRLREGLGEIDNTATKHMAILPSGTDHRIILLSSVVGLMGCIARSTLEMKPKGNE